MEGAVPTSSCQEAVDRIRQQIGVQPVEIAIVLGSGLGEFAGRIEHPQVIAYRDIPHFRPCGVEGHSGNLIFGTVGGRQVVCQQGRYHYYEGHQAADIVLPIRVMSKLGAKYLLVTNAAGGINEGFDPGDIMLIRDHINFMGMNPLRGPNESSFGPRFPDMSHAYDPELGELMLHVARDASVFLREGTYLAVSGPSYETPAEIRMFRTLGADAVGMSTVPEVIAANHLGMKVTGLSCISNAAAGMEDQTLSHDDVSDVVGRSSAPFESLVSRWIERLP